MRDKGAMSDPRTFDYIIIGAGSAGSILANRLTEDSAVSVLVVEAGGSERHTFVEMPAAFIKTVDDPRFNSMRTRREGTEQINLGEKLEVVPLSGRTRFDEILMPIRG